MLNVIRGLALSIIVLTASGCLVIIGDGSISSESSAIIRVTDQEYPPRPKNHPIDVYLDKAYLQDDRLKSIKNRKNKSGIPDQSITLFRAYLKYEHDKPSLKYLIRDLIEDTRAEGGDGLALMSVKEMQILESNTWEYEFAVLRYPDPAE